MVENSVRCCVVNGSLGEVAGQLLMGAEAPEFVYVAFE